MSEYPRRLVSPLSWAFLAATLLACASPGGSRGGPLLEGSTLSPFSIRDQHGETHRIDRSVRAIVFGREMGAGEIIKNTLAESGARLLTDARAVYVADVSGMPSIIRKLFAEPKLRKRPYPMLLDRDGSATTWFPGEEGRATLLILEQLEIVAIRHIASADELRTELSELAGRADGGLAR